MHRTQIYFEENLFEEIKEQAKQLNISMSAYIRKTLKKDLQENKKKSNTTKLSDFAGMWEGRDITQESIRKDAWK
jgi:metal-responsive CopG/Arc/MetJ family transcriptional regulator